MTTRQQIPEGLGGFRTTPVGADMLYELQHGTKLTAVWGGVGSGKSWAIAQTACFAAMTRQAWDPEAEAPAGPIDILVCGRHRSELKQNLWRAFDDVVGAIGGRWINDPKWYRWELPGGARITFQHYQCVGGDEKNSLEGRTYSILMSDETAQLPSSYWTHAFERCRRPSVDIWGRVFLPQLFWIGRPAPADGYLREAKRRAEAGTDVTIIYARTRDNPWNGPDYLETIRQGRSVAEFEAVTQETIGATFPTQGAIYSEWEAASWPEGNLYDLPDDAAERPTWVVIDTSILHTSVIWVQVHEVAGEQLLVIVDEWHPHGQQTSTQAIIEEVRARPWQLAGVIIDPAARSRNKAARLRSEVDVISRGPDEDPDGLGGGLGLPVRSVLPKERRSVFDGVMRVKARICSAAGARHLVIARHLWDEPPHVAGVRHTIQAYAWDPVTSEPQKGKDCDHADHCADVLRYTVAHLAWFGAPRPIVAEEVESTPPIRHPRLQTRSRRR
ncbi:MAG: hypothetical protein H6705_16690 [Myxococcales bacterium]|nr:hypothetical protein [Myxococcales bacterium]